MNGKENIINKILSDADTKCQEIVAQAQAQADQIISIAKALADAETQSVNKRLATLSVERERNLKASAVLEARKYRLGKKQQLISRCYEKAQDELKSLSAKEKEKFLSKLIQTYAEDGETVLICKSDKDIVTQKFLDSFGKKLVLGKNFAEIDGGVILQGNGYDKDLSLAQVLSAIRNDTEAEVANALFGE